MNAPILNTCEIERIARLWLIVNITTAPNVITRIIHVNVLPAWSGELTGCPLNLGSCSQFAIIAYRFRRAILHRLSALAFLFRRLRLFEDEGMTKLLVTRDICWGSLSTLIAVDALIVHVVAPRRIFKIPICNVCHKITSG
jgi:hypothetical protein